MSGMLCPMTDKQHNKKGKKKVVVVVVQQHSITLGEGKKIRNFYTACNMGVAPGARKEKKGSKERTGPAAINPFRWWMTSNGAYSASVASRSFPRISESSFDPSNTYKRKRKKKIFFLLFIYIFFYSIVVAVDILASNLYFLPE